MELSRREFLKYSAGTTGIVMLCSTGKASASDREESNGRGKAVLVDTTRCIGCWWCYAACKHGNNLPETIRPDPENPPKLNSTIWTTLSTAKKDNDRIFAKRQCMHCEHPACVAACPVGALRKTPEGPVIYDETRCFGCRYCMVACPFGVPDFEWEDPTPWIKKCDFCTERLAEGKEPACVDACTSGALKFGERDALLAEARERIKTSPDKYIDHIYGENEAGGTSWLYLSSVPFEELGLPVLGSEPVTVDAERAMGAVPPVLLGVAALMSGVYWLVKRRERMSKATAGEKEKGEVNK
jgi:formate dehydrogenase iron-sulfur subunit